MLSNNSLIVRIKKYKYDREFPTIIPLEVKAPKR